MSLITDKIFVEALRSNSALMNQLAAKDVYNITIAMPDVDLDNAELPYLIVSYDGMNEQKLTKDGNDTTDRVNITVWGTARTRQELGSLLASARQTIDDYFTAHEFDEAEPYNLIPLDWVMKAGPVNYDQDKPCYYQTMSYDCETLP